MIRCYLCDQTATSPQAACDADWTPYFFLAAGADEEGEAACPDCSGKFLRSDADGEQELLPGLTVAGCRQETGRTETEADR
jgi:hypothetical protein